MGKLMTVLTEWRCEAGTSNTITAIVRICVINRFIIAFIHGLGSKEVEKVFSFVTLLDQAHYLGKGLDTEFINDICLNFILYFVSKR